MAEKKAANGAGKRRKVIITCAVTGSVHTPSMTPYLPITPDEIAREFDRRGRGRRLDHPSACARPEKRQADARSRDLHAISCRASSKAAMRSSTSRPAVRSA